VARLESNPQSRARRSGEGITLLLAVLFLLSACISPSAGSPQDSAQLVCPQPNPRLEVTSKELNLFVFVEYLPDAFVKCFEEAYDIKVNRTEYATGPEMYAKLAAGGANYDIVQPTDYLVEPMIRQGLLQKLDKAKLHIMQGFDPDYLNKAFDPGNDYTLPYEAGSYAIAANSSTVENLPSRWADLWNEEYADRLVFLDDARAVIGLTLMTLGYDLNSTDPAQLEQAKERLLELVPNIKLFDSASPKSALIAGDVDLGMVWTGEAFLAHKELPSIEYIYPEEGAILWQDNYAIPADAPHPDAAYAWINYTLQPDLFWMMLRDFPYTNPSKAALEYAKANHPELYNAYMESNITNMPAAALQNGKHLQDVGEALPLYDEIWTEVKGN
jgi:spermidine/putrescine-binding protein